jgi:ABC-type molybdate transport system substrate-binding protein
VPQLAPYGAAAVEFIQYLKSERAKAVIRAFGYEL